MRPHVAKVLVCPLCRGGLDAKVESRGEGNEILDGELHCASGCGARYPVSSGLPVLLPNGHASSEARQTAESFSAKWRHGTRYRTEAGRFYRQWFLDRYGFGSENGLGEFLAGRRTILDAGTGTGRDAEMYAGLSQADIYAVDISEGILTAHRDLGKHPRLHFLRADLTRLPFPPGFFDFVACDQVLHHTPDTRLSLARLTDALKPGGHIAFYVYRRKGPLRELADDYLRERTTRMAVEACMQFSDQVTQLARSLAESNATVRVPVDIPLLDLKAGEYDLQRFLHWNVFKCFWNSEFDHETNRLINFDWYHPALAHRHTEPEVRAWCEELRLTPERLFVGDSGISVLARK